MISETTYSINTPSKEYSASEHQLRFATQADVEPILNNIVLCHTEGLDHDLYSEKELQEVTSDYLRLMDNIFEKHNPEEFGTIIVAQDPEGRVNSCIAVKPEVDEPLDKWLHQPHKENNRKRASLLSDAKLSHAAGLAAHFGMWYTRPFLAGRGIGKEEFAAAADLVSSQGAESIIYYTSRRAGKTFSNKHFSENYIGTFATPYDRQADVYFLDLNDATIRKTLSKFRLKKDQSSDIVSGKP